MGEMRVPRSKSEYFPDPPTKATKARKILLFSSILILILSLPALFTPDEVSVYTDSTILTSRTVEEGKIDYETISYQFSTHTSGVSPNGTIRVTAHARWGSPYNPFQESSTKTLQTALIIAPAAWSEQKVTDEGTIIMNNVTSIKKGDGIQFEKELHISKNITVSGIGPDKATLYYFIQENPNTGPSKFGELRTYNVYRGFWDRPRTYSLLVSMILIGAIGATYHPSVSQLLRNLLNQYAVYRWRSDLEEIAGSLEDKFSEFTTREMYTSEILVEIRNTSPENLSTTATKLNEFQLIYQSISGRDEEFLTPSLYHSLQSTSAAAFQENDIKKARKLRGAIHKLENGISVKVRDESYIVDQLREDFHSSIKSGSVDDLDEVTEDFSKFQDSKEIVEQWSQINSTDADPHHTAIAAYIGGEWIEPTNLWSNIEQSLTNNDIASFIEEAKTVAQIASITEPLRTNLSSSKNKYYLITNPSAENELIDKACKAMQSGDPSGLKDILYETEAKVAEDDILKYLRTTDLTYTSIKPDRISNRVKKAKTRGNWEQIKQIRNKIENKLDSAWKPSDLLNLNSVQFEKILGLMYSQIGYDVQVTQQSGDRGVDVIASNGQNILAIQAKRYDPRRSGNVSGPEVRTAIGATVQMEADTCVIATSSGFSEEAVRAAKETSLIEVELLAGRDVAAKLSEANVQKPW